jgi:hypothetical protein
MHEFDAAPSDRPRKTVRHHLRTVIKQVAFVVPAVKEALPALRFGAAWSRRQGQIPKRLVVINPEAEWQRAPYDNVKVHALLAKAQDGS